MLSRFFRSPKPSLPSGQRVYAIGDVHGRIDLLDQLLSKLEADNASRNKADTLLVFLGDLIDRGPASRKVVTRVRSGVYWARTISLMGNHEAVMLEVLEGKQSAVINWLRFGGRETLLDWDVPKQTLEEGTTREIVHATQQAVSLEERGWLSRLRTHIRIGGYYFVHAGIRPGVPLQDQADDDRLWIREEFLASRKDHGAVIVHGHSINPTVEDKPNRIGLDTGAYMSECLTAVGLERGERWYISTKS